jgi:hypothetical protein
MIEYFDECGTNGCDVKVSSRISKRGKRPKNYSLSKPKKEFYGDARFKNGDYNDSYECHTHKEELCFDIDDCDCECGDPIGNKGVDGSKYLKASYIPDKSLLKPIKTKYNNKLIDYGDGECCGEACR